MGCPVTEKKNQFLYIVIQFFSLSMKHSISESHSSNTYLLFIVRTNAKYYRGKICNSWL